MNKQTTKVKENKIIHLNELGLIYKKFKLYDEAFNSLNKARTINPSNIKTLENIAALNKILENYHEAIIEYETIRKIKKDYYLVYESLGKMYIKILKNKKAKKVFEELLRIKPNYKNKAEIKSLISRLNN